MREAVRGTGERRLAGVEVGADVEVGEGPLLPGVGVRADPGIRSPGSLSRLGRAAGVCCWGGAFGVRRSVGVPGVLHSVGVTGRGTGPVFPAPGIGPCGKRPRPRRLGA
ncbi:hypothetical protein, partial [Streptomyces prunicolor]